MTVRSRRVRYISVNIKSRKSPNCKNVSHAFMYSVQITFRNGYDRSRWQHQSMVDSLLVRRVPEVMIAVRFSSKNPRKILDKLCTMIAQRIFLQ